MDDMYYESDEGYGSEDSVDDGLLEENVDHKVDEFGESRSSKENYTVLKQEEIAKLQDAFIADVSTVLSISKSDACLLLPRFHWRVEDLKDAWFSDEDKVREDAGLLKKPVVEHNARANLRVSCGICFEDYNFDRFILSASCGHPFCRDCWTGYISTTICDGGPACVSLRCPEPSCKAAVGSDLIEKTLLMNSNRGAEYDKYKTYLLRSYVEDQKTIKWCPAPDCNFAVQFHAEGKMVSYDVSCLSSHSYCWNCSEENHSPVDCETVGKWILKNKDDSQNAQWIMVNSKPCPKCKRPIEKNQGCNHMMCRPPCGYQFCWLCLGSNKNYQGCHCNRYRRGPVDNAETSMNMDEKARKKAKMYLEKYIHYYERWATNGRSKQKALEDFNKVKSEHIKQLGEIQGNTREHEYEFIIEAWQQIIKCRQVLRWTYAYGYYLPQDGEVKKHLFEGLQGYAELSLERLHNCAESELQQFLVSSSSSSEAKENFNKFKAKLVGLTKVTGTYFKKLVTALEEGLSETPQYGAGAAFKEIDWRCEMCSFINVGSAATCAVCFEENPHGFWACQRCTFKSPATTTRCLMCDPHDADQGGED